MPTKNPLAEGIDMLVNEQRPEARGWFTGILEQDLSPEVRQLTLHVAALLHYSQHHREQGVEVLAQALEVEKEHATAQVCQHTSHQIAFLSQEGPRLLDLLNYYKDTLKTTQKMGNKAGTGLMYKSLGEFEVVRGHPLRAQRAFHKAAQAFGADHPEEQKLLQSWSDLLKDDL